MCKLVWAGGLRDQNDFNCNEGLAKRRFGWAVMRDIKDDGMADVRYGNGCGLHFCDNTHIRFMNTLSTMSSHLGEALPLSN